MLVINNLYKTYDNKFLAIKDVSLVINEGEIVGFIGPNGAGKTTTIKAIMGLINYEKGSISFKGMNVSTNPIQYKKKIVYIPDNPDLYDSLTGIQYLNFIADIYDISQKERQTGILKYANLYNITNSLGNLISSYSHGMKQKLALISAFIRKPELLILDEPFVGLDPEAAFNTKTIMREICDRGGSVFFSTHVLEVAEKLCDHVAIIANGEIKAFGTMEEVIGDQSLEETFFNLALKHGDDNGKTI